MGGRDRCMECDEPLNRGNPRALKCMDCLEKNTQRMNERRKKHYVSAELRRRLERAFPCCAYCGGQSEGDRSLEVDHLIPTVRGGETTFENLVLACRSCNRSKANKTPKEAGMTFVVGGH